MVSYSASENLSFRLKRAHFFDADAVLKILVGPSPHIFSGLEEFRIQEPLRDESYQMESTFVEVLSLARETLQFCISSSSASASRT